MKLETIQCACDRLINGGIGDFRNHLKKCSKSDMLRTLEYLAQNYTDYDFQKGFYRVQSLLE